MNTRKIKLTLGTILVLALVVTTTAIAFTGEEPTTTWNVTPQEKDFPADRPLACPGDGYEFYNMFDTQGETPGTYTESFVIDGVTVTVEVTVNADKTIDFNITNGVATEVWFKSAKYFLYQYDPKPLLGTGTNTGPVSYDTGLHDGVNNNGNYNALSHLDACIYPVYPLRAEKTAAGSYDRTVTWTLNKSVDVDSHTGNAGEVAGTSNWTVVADKSETLGNYAVTGSITVYNDNIFDVPVTIGDELDDGTVATVTCPSDTVPAGGSLTCTYTASPADGSATLNTATITSASTEFSVGGAVATAGVAFTENLIGFDSGTLSDDNEFNPNDPTVISGDTTWTYGQTFTCSDDPADYGTNGEYSFNVPNTATLNGNLNLSDTENVTVTCTLPALKVTKTAAGFYDRKVDWTLEKSVSPDSHSGNAGEDAGTSTWTVVATKSETFLNFNVEGTITVSNPAAIAQTFSVSDELNDGTVATVTCDIYTIPAGGTANCTYDETVDDDSATLNTATVSATGNADQTATAAVSFSEENVIGDDTVTVDDDRDTEGQFPAVISTSTTFDYDETFVCSSDAADYTNGFDSDTYLNTATLKGDNTNLSDDASVTVDCTLAALTVSKDAAGTYDRTVTWTLDKSVDDDFHTGFAGQVAGTSNWSVVADKTEVSDNYAVTGTISITNPAAITQEVTDVSDVLNDGTGATVVCGAAFPIDIAAGDTLECSYTASPADGSATLNTATVSATGNADQMATAGVSFTENLIGYDSGTLSDNNEFNPNGPTVISGDTTWNYNQEFTCPTDLTKYDANGKYSLEVPNTATLNGNINLSDTESVTVDCYIPLISKTAEGTYVRTHTWDIEKSVNPLDQSGSPGDTLSWTWTVDVSETYVDSNFKIKGVITLTNPNPDDDLVVVITDTANGNPPSVIGIAPNAATNCNLTGANGITWTLGPGETGTCNYVSTVTWDSLADAPTQNDVRAHLNFGTPNHVAVKHVEPVSSWTATVINGTATVNDDQEPDLPTTLTAGQGPWQWTETQSHMCSLSRTDYNANGTYSQTPYNLATVTGSDGQTDSDDATTRYECIASFVDIYKTTNGAPADPLKDIKFDLYSGQTLLDTVSTLGNGAEMSFQTALRPGDSYTICESPVPAGYTFEISVDGGNVLTYAGPPGAENPTGEIQCFDFIAADPGTQVVLTFNIENSFPGGAPRTPGYWKNWNMCSGGNQADTAYKLNDGFSAGEEGFQGVYLLEDLLPQTLGDFLTIENCEDGVSILDARDLEETDKKGNFINRSNDAAYTLARALLAARLNQDAGACTASGFDFLAEYGFDGTFEELLTAADNVLTAVEFDGSGSFLSPQDTKGKNNPNSDLAAEALFLYEIIDDYNNGLICTGEPSH